MSKIEAYDWSSVCRVPNCQRPVNIVLESSDGQRYGAHYETLVQFNDDENFPPFITYAADGSGNSPALRPFCMNESGYLIRLLLLFSHNTEHPELDTFDIDLVVDFLQTATKYQNWPAVQACKSAISTIAKRSPIDALRVLRYKACHSDYEEIDDIARRTMKVSTQLAAAWLKDIPAIYMSWYQYKIEWERRMIKFREILDTGSKEYFFFSNSNMLWAAFRSEVEAEEIPTLAGLQRAVEVVKYLNEGSWYGSLNKRLVNDLESVVESFPLWCNMEAC